jgi:hypothetical protein
VIVESPSNGIVAANRGIITSAFLNVTEFSTKNQLTEIFDL